MKQVSALVFDAYGTLFDVHSVASTAELLFPGKGQALSQLWRTKQLEYTWQRSLMQRHADFNRVTQDALGYACDALKLAHHPAQAVQLVAAYRTLAPYPDAREALSQLTGRKKLAILSNGAPDMLNAVVAHNNMLSLFDAVLSVEDVGVFKPDPRVYTLAVTRLGVPANEIGFVSSNCWDAAGAKAFGFTVFWINRAAAPVDRLGVTPDAVLTSLNELAALVD